MAMEALGSFERHDDVIDVRFERHYPRPIETVWRALTEPERLADWMGVCEMEPFVGGRVQLMKDIAHPMHGEVLVWEPPRVLEFSWTNTHAPNSVVRYELEPAAGGTLLVFTHLSMPYENSALMLPGWHDFFTRLGLALGGMAPAGEMDFRAMQAAYIERYELRDVNLDP